MVADAIAYSFGPDNLIINHNEIRKVLPTSAGFGDVILDNDGVVDVHNGSLKLNQGSLVQLADTTLTGGTWKVFNAGTLSLSWPRFRRSEPAQDSPVSVRPRALVRCASLTRIEGSVRVYGGGSLNVAPVGGIFTNAGYLFLNNSTKLNVQGATTFRPRPAARRRHRRPLRAERRLGCRDSKCHRRRRADSHAREWLHPHAGAGVHHPLRTFHHRSVCHAQHRRPAG